MAKHTYIGLADLLPASWRQILFENNKEFRDETDRIGCELDTQKRKEQKRVIPAPEFVFFSFHLCPPSVVHTIVFVDDEPSPVCQRFAYSRDMSTEKYQTLNNSDPMATGGTKEEEERCAKVWKKMHLEFKCFDSYQVCNCACQPPCSESIVSWLFRGVLFLRISLTADAHQPNAHRIVWQKWISLFLQTIDGARSDLTYLFLGSAATTSFCKKLSARHPHWLAFGAPDEQQQHDKRIDSFANEPNNNEDEPTQQQPKNKQQQRLTAFVGSQCFRSAAIASQRRRKAERQFNWSLLCLKELSEKK